MATNAFNDFIQLELPRRPFTYTDGLSGQTLVRSNNPLAPREMVWADAGTGVGGSSAFTLQLEAGEDLAAGDPVYTLNAKFYKADHLVNFRVVGIIKDAALATQQATAVTSGAVLLPALVPASPYYLGAGAITTTAPAAGYVVRLGIPLTTAMLLVNIEEPILLT